RGAGACRPARPVVRPATRAARHRGRGPGRGVIDRGAAAGHARGGFPAGRHRVRRFADAPPAERARAPRPLRRPRCLLPAGDRGDGRSRGARTHRPRRRRTIPPHRGGEG
ncbi:MAG: hypothetical protein ACK55Z_34860, partial [bacterium]